MPKGPAGLGLIELICFGLVIGFCFYLCSQSDLLNQLDPAIRRRLVGNRTAAQQLFISFATTLAIYFVVLSFLPISPSVRLAGSMLATVVSVVVLYVSLVALKNVVASAAMLALAPGSALSTRCGVSRQLALRSTLVAAPIICWVHASFLHLF